MYIYTVQIYGELQDENSIRILEETIRAFLEKADALKCNSYQFLYGRPRVRIGLLAWL